VRHKSINTPSSQVDGRGTHVTHFVQLYPQPLYTASQVRTTCRSWHEGLLTDLCLTLYYSPLHVSRLKCSSSEGYSFIHATYGTVTLYKSSWWLVGTQLEWELTVGGRLLWALGVAPVTMGKRKMETESPHPNMSSAVWESEPRGIGSRGKHLVHHW